MSPDRFFHIQILPNSILAGALPFTSPRCLQRTVTLQGVHASRVKYFQIQLLATVTEPDIEKQLNIHQQELDIWYITSDGGKQTWMTSSVELLSCG